MQQVKDAPTLAATEPGGRRLPDWWTPLMCGLCAALLLGAVGLVSSGLGSTVNNLGIVAAIAALAPAVSLFLADRRTRGRWLALTIVLLAVGAAGILSASAAYRFQIAQAEAHGAYPTAINDLRALGARPPYAQDLAQAYLDWAAAEASAHVYDSAVTHLTYVATQFPTTPQAATAGARLPDVHLAWARYAAAQHDPITAGQQYQIVLSAYPTSTAAQPAGAEAPAAYLAWGEALAQAKFYANADTAFQLIITGYPQNAVFGQARQQDAQALLAWAQQLTTAGDYDQAATLYQRLVTDFADTPPGQQAQAAIKQGVQVTGRLLKADGKTPALAGTTVRLSSKWSVANGSYAVSGQQYVADTDANGYFVFPSVPPGQYLLEWRSTTGIFQTTFNGTTPTLLVTVSPLNAITLAPVTSNQP